MKHLIILLIFFWSPLFDEKLILGEWKLADMKIIETIKGEKVERAISKLEEIKQKTTFSFSDEKKIGKKYVFEINGIVEKGIWSIKDNTYLLTTSESRASQNVKIEKLEEKSMVLVAEQTGRTITYFFAK
jgi:ribosomal protein L22